MQGDVHDLEREDYKRRLEEFRKTGVMEDDGVSMDADGNIYERIDGEWVKA